MEAHEPFGAPAPLLGREQDLRLLWRVLEQAAAGGLRVVLVAGERGIGKANPNLLRSQVGDAGPLLAPLFPELTLRLGSQPVRYPLPAEQSRLIVLHIAWRTSRGQGMVL